MRKSTLSICGSEPRAFALIDAYHLRKCSERSPARERRGLLQMLSVDLPSDCSWLAEVLVISLPSDYGRLARVIPWNKSKHFPSVAEKRGIIAEERGSLLKIRAIPLYRNSLLQ